MLDGSSEDSEDQEVSALWGQLASHTQYNGSGAMVSLGRQEQFITLMGR